MNALGQFSQESARPLPRADFLALLVGTMLDPTLSVERYLMHLDELACQVRPIVAGQQGADLPQALLQALGQDLGFRGNLGDYYDPENSFLHRVIDRRLGLPITLSLLYMSIGQRLNIPLTGMGFPGHFMLRFADAEGDFLIDPFHQRTLSTREGERYLSTLFQSPIHLQTSLSAYQMTPFMVLARLLNNLRVLYITRQDFRRTLEVLNFMVVVAPQEAALWRERGLLHFQAHELLAAESDLRRFFYQTHQLHHFIEQRPVAGLQPFGPAVENRPFTELNSETLELLSVIDRIRRDVARLN